MSSASMKIWHLMWIILADNSHEMSNLIYYEKIKKNKKI